jgi:hypothetical protein
MRDRFTRSSRVGRGKIPREMRTDVFARDEHTCQFCGNQFGSAELTIDHLVPLALGGLDEMTNYVTACGPCNAKKGSLPLSTFAAQVNVPIEELPVHGDPVIDNVKLPIQIRLIRKRVFDRMRLGALRAGGRSAQKRIEKEYRRSFWDSPMGKELEAAEPTLPGQVRIMIPEIRTVAKTECEYILLVELAKSAATRGLIGSVLRAESDIVTLAWSLRDREERPAHRKRLDDALTRFVREAKKRRLECRAHGAI